MHDKGLTRHSLVYIGSAGVNALVPFLVLPWLARWLGPAGFGTVGTFMALVNLAAVFVGLSVHGRISVSYFRDGPQTLPAQVGACFGVMALTALPALAALLLAAPQVSAVTGVESPWLWCVWVAACGQFVVMAALAVWQVERTPYRYAMTQIGFTLCWAALSLALVGAAGMGWQGRALGQALGALVAGGACLVVLSTLKRVDWNPRRWPLRSALAFGVPLLPHSLAAVAMASIDRFALSGSVGAEAAGHYFLAFQVAALLSVGAAAINQAWVPWMYRRLSAGTPQAGAELVRTTYVLYALLLAGAVLMSLLAPLLVRWIAGPGFEPAVPLLALLAPAAAFSGMYYFVTGYLFYAGRTGTLSMITLACATVQVVLTLLLVRADGPRGVAIAALVSAALYWAATAAVAQRIHPMPWLRKVGP